jgi:hypothetical protein
MQKIPINLVEPGMVLARPIISDKGMQLCAEETELTPVIIARLIKMQIPVVTVKGDPPVPIVKSASNGESVRELNARFSKVAADPLMDKIRAAVENALLSDDDAETGGVGKGNPA